MSARPRFEVSCIQTCFFFGRYAKRLQALYFWPVALVVISAITGVGIKIYTSFVAGAVPLFLYLVIGCEIGELAAFCAIGTLVDVCVRTVFLCIFSYLP